MPFNFTFNDSSRSSAQMQNTQIFLSCHLKKNPITSTFSRSSRKLLRTSRLRILHSATVILLTKSFPGISVSLHCLVSAGTQNSIWKSYFHFHSRKETSKTRHGIRVFFVVDLPTMTLLFSVTVAITHMESYSHKLGISKQGNHFAKF